jgi:hypothetical protein
MIPPDNNARFWAYSNYLIALARLIHLEHPTINELNDSMARSPAYNKLLETPNVNRYELAKLLRISWSTELLLRETIKYGELLPYAIPWSMVQGYYAVYLAIRSYFLALGRHVDTAHAVTLRTISGDLVGCKGRFPSPWCCVLTGDPNVKNVTLVNIPCDPAAPITLGNPLFSPYTDDPCQHFGLFLKTTRQRQVKSNSLIWKKENKKKRLPRSEYLRLVQEYRATSIFDTLYRVRIRSNYLDIDSFAFSGAKIDDFYNLQVALCDVVYYTLMVFEVLIGKAVGKKMFRTFVDEFSETSLGKAAGQTVVNRWKVISGSNK